MDKREERLLLPQQQRLNETALLIDAQLTSPAALSAGWSAAAMQQLFDAEVSLSNQIRIAWRSLFALSAESSRCTKFSGCSAPRKICGAE